MRKLIVSIVLTAVILSTFYDIFSIPRDSYTVTHHYNEHDMIVQDRWNRSYIVTCENTFAYPRGFRFVGWTLKDISGTCVYNFSY